MGSRGLRGFLTVVMDVLVFLAIALTARLVVLFFGQLASLGWAQAIIAFTKWFTVPFGAPAIKTPYGGIFEVNAAITIALLLAVEWVLSSVRDRS